MNGGNYIPVSSFASVTDTQNQNVLAQPSVTPQRILSEEQAYLLTDMLMPGTEYGSIRELDVPFPAALTASASQNGSAQWAIGYTHIPLVGVCVEIPESEEPETSLLAGDLWVQFMTEAAALTPESGDNADTEEEAAAADYAEFEVP